MYFGYILVLFFFLEKTLFLKLILDDAILQVYQYDKPVFNYYGKKHH